MKLTFAETDEPAVFNLLNDMLYITSPDTRVESEDKLVVQSDIFGEVTLVYGGEDDIDRHYNMLAFDFCFESLEVEKEFLEKFHSLMEASATDVEYEVTGVNL